MAKKKRKGSHRGVGIVKKGASCAKGYHKVHKRMGKGRGMRDMCVLR